MKRNYGSMALALLLAACLLSGCGAQNTSTTVSVSAAASSDTAQEDAEQAATGGADASAIDTASLFSDRDLDGSYDAASVIAIQLQGDSVTCDSDAVTIQDGIITISQEGVYLVTGTWEDGQIQVNAPDDAKVQLVLSGASITSSSSAAIYARNADKVFLTLAENTENTLTNGGEYVAIDENNIDAVIFAKTDLTLNGSGSLTINAAAGHGVAAKDELTITQGSYTITAASHGLSAKDSLAVADGSFAITSGKDGIHVENTDDASLGIVYLAGGSFVINAEGDAISASGALQIDDGSYKLTTGGGSASVVMTSSEPSAGRSKRDESQTGADASAAATQAGQATESQEELMNGQESVSQKGIKAEGSFTLLGGTFTLDTADDGLHTGSDLLISGGEFEIRSGDDGIHSDGAVIIQNGCFNIPYCYEGIEGLSITIEDGDFQITSEDDGLNAAGGADSSGFGGFGRGGQDSFSSDSGIEVVINGGTFVVVSKGDCIDSNGALTINGGTLDLTCNGSGNTALDADGSYTNNGGTVTTNDGSETTGGGMTGGMEGSGQGSGRKGGAAPGGEPPAHYEGTV